METLALLRAYVVDFFHWLTAPQRRKVGYKVGALVLVFLAAKGLVDGDLQDLLLGLLAILFGVADSNVDLGDDED